MSGRDLVAEAVAALCAHRLRATLALFGIIAGVAAIVSALTIGEGARRAAIAQIAGLGLTNVFVRAVPAAPGATRGDAPARRRISPRAYDVVRAARLGPSALSRLRLAPTTLAAGSARLDGLVVAADSEWRTLAGLSLRRGRFLTADDERTRRRVMILGAEAAAALFGARDPLGQRVRTSDDWFVVAGVLAARGAPAASGTALSDLDLDRAALVSLSTLDAGAGEEPGAIDLIVVQARDERSVDTLATGLAAALSAGRFQRGTDYELIVPRELLQARLRAQRTWTIVLYAFSVLALGIGGIGIMNIMLANVTERTMEIGVRRAFGATRRDIARQFATEAMTLAAAGGVAGLVVGVTLSIAIAWVAAWPIAVSARGLLLAMTLAVTVGLGCGIYPAQRAARLEPAEAVRE